MAKRKIGDQTACRYCGHDIEFHGRGHGWVDRGNGRNCLPYTKPGRIVLFPTTKHAPPPKEG